MSVIVLGATVTLTYLKNLISITTTFLRQTVPHKVKGRIKAV